MKLKNPFFYKKSSLLLSKIIETINSKDINYEKIHIKRFCKKEGHKE